MLAHRARGVSDTFAEPARVWFQMTNCDLCGGIGSSPFLTKGDLAYVRCTACGLVQADMTPEEFERQ